MLWFFGLKPRWDSYQFWRSNTQVISSQCWPSPCSASKLFVCILNLKAFKPSTSICIFSILFSIHSLRGWEGEFVSNQEFLYLIGDHFLIILVALKFDLGVISLREMRCWSVMGIKVVKSLLQCVMFDLHMSFQRAWLVGQYRLIWMIAL